MLISLIHILCKYNCLQVYLLQKTGSDFRIIVRRKYAKIYYVCILPQVISCLLRKTTTSEHLCKPSFNMPSQSNDRVCHSGYFVFIGYENQERNASVNSKSNINYYSKDTLICGYIKIFVTINHWMYEIMYEYFSNVSLEKYKVMVKHF